ncbi:ATP-binding cassette domain-containing protein [Microbacterium sp. LWS13-1.2]|uniref:ATP-binding cassette domain-containing protein n=1 Tax=Microbacterium sp. LWS13-1.2 TaxID=3135264 RepID=A0AAU6S6M9_9MICO
MTASLPVPNDIDPEEPDRHSAASVMRLAETVPPAPDKPRRPPRKPRSDKDAPRKKRAPRSAEPQPDPGPPPPLPSDLELAASAAAGIVVPPRPPLPQVADVPSADARPAPAAEPEASPQPAPEAATAPSEATQVATAPEVACSTESSSDPAPLADSVAVVEAEPVVDSAPVAEPAAAVEPAPEAVSEPAPAASAPVAIAPVAPEPVAEPEVEPTPTPLAADAAADTTSAVDGAPAAASVLLDTPPLPAAAGDALVLRGVTKRFGSTHAVDGIDLTVPAGTFYGLVGPNGAGKTTTLSMIAGLLEPDRGTIHISGVDAAAKPLAVKRLMGVLPDRLRTFDRLTGRQLLYYYGVLRKLPPAVVESRTADLARAFDLEDALGRSVSDYSAGMLKKVMLAGALIHSPRLLVLDEPFEAVDPVSSAIILDILSTYVAHGGTVILSSHGMDLVERVCTRVAVIVAGQVLAEGTVAEVRGELTLEQRFVELAGGLSDVEGLEWLHTFSD